MKTRRALQIIVGVLSLLVVLCLVVAGAFVAFVALFPNTSPIATELYEMFVVSFDVIAGYMGLTGMSYLVPLLFYAFPAVLLLIAGILTLLRDKGKPCKYLVANVFALIGATVVTVFTMLFAGDLVSRVNGDNHVWFVGEFSWTSMDMIVRYVCAGVLVLFALFVGLALGVKPKKVETATEEVETEAESETEAQVEEIEEQQEQHSEYETIAPSSEQQTTAYASTTEYVPSDTSVSDVTEGAYGTNNAELTPVAIDKIKKARSLYEMGALTKEEYIKLVNVYLKK